MGLPGGVTARFHFSLQSTIAFHSGSPMLLVSSHPKNTKFCNKLKESGKYSSESREHAHNTKSYGPS